MQASLIKRANDELLRHATVTKPDDLRKDKPDPMAGLFPVPQFVEDCVIHALLRVEKALEVVSGAHKLSAAKYILSGTTACPPMFDS